MTQRPRRGTIIGVSIVLGVFAVYLVVMAILEKDAHAAVAACHPAGTLTCQALAQAFRSDYWGAAGGGS